MSVLVRLCGALTALALACLALAYALSLAGISVPGPDPFARSKAEAVCLMSGSPCDGARLVPLSGLAPIADEPLSGLLREAFEAGDLERARQLAPLVFARDKRNELGRLLMAQEALAGGDKQAFLRLYLPLFSTDGRQGAIYAGALAELSADSQFFAEIERHIRREQPSWAPAYLRILRDRNVTGLKELIGLYKLYPQAQAGLVSQLVREGDWRRAYAVFAEFVLSAQEALPVEERPLLSAPFNPDLLEVAAPAPFNWRVYGNGAEFLDGGGVYAFFQGRKAEQFLSQVFPLTGGRYEFVARMSGDVSETGGWFRWQIGCAGSGTRIAAFDVDRLSAAPMEQAFAFDMPEGLCDFVSLSLVGVAGTFPQSARIEIAHISLGRTGPLEAAP
jgi:hypothetical protein